MTVPASVGIDDTAWMITCPGAKGVMDYDCIARVRINVFRIVLYSKWVRVDIVGQPPLR